MTTSPPPRGPVWREVRPFAMPAVIALVYAGLRIALAAFAHGRGLLTPGGDVDPTLAGLALAALALRMLCLSLVAWLVAYRLVMRIAARWLP